MNGDSEYGHYSVIMEWDHLDRIYVVTVPELPGCMTHGATLEEAARQANEAIESWIDAAQDWERAVPKPRHFDINCSSYVGHNVIEERQRQEAV